MARRASALALILIALLPFWAVLSPDHALYFGHHAAVSRRLFALVRAAYRAGELPLWDPLVGGGEPLAAQPASVAFSPLHALTALLPASWDPYDLFVATLYAVGAGGMLALGRVLGLDARPRWTAAALFALGGPLISLNHRVPALHSAVFGPWVLAAALAVWRAPSPRGLAALAVALALHAAGADPALWVGDVLVFVALVPWVDRPGPAPARRAVWLAGGLGLGAALAAVQLWPLLELLASRAAGYPAAAAGAMHPLQLAELSMPGLSGDLFELKTMFHLPQGGRHDLASLYLSALAWPALVAGLAARRTRGLAAVALIAALIALGPATPLFGWVQVVFPGASSARFPVQYVYGAALAAPLVVAVMVERALAAPIRAAVLGLGAWMTVVTLLGQAPPAWVGEHAGAVRLDEEGVRALLVGASAQAALVTVAVLVVVVMVARRPAWAWALPPLLAVDVGLAARPVLTTAAPLPSAPPPLARLVLAGAPDPSVFRYEPPLPPLDLAAATARGFALLEPMGASPFGIRSVLDRDLHDLRPPAWSEALARVRRETDERARLRMLARWGTTHLVVSARRRDPPGLQYVGTASVAHAPPMSVFRVRGARPLLSFAATARAVPDRAAALDALTSSAAPELVLVGDDPPALGPARGATLSGSREALEVDAPVDGWVVLAQRYDAGWRAEVDGRAAPVRLADGVMLAVAVPAGRHRVSFAYAPRSVTGGAYVSGLALLVVLALWARGGSGARAGLAAPARRARSEP